MSEDIRVYWDGEADCYYTFIGGYSLKQWGGDLSISDFLHYEECQVSKFIPVVYDSAEDADNDEWEFSLIDENLVVPDLIEVYIVSTDDDCKWDNNDHQVWNNGLFDHYIYHDERTA